MISNQRGVMRSNKIINTNNKKYKSLHLKNSNTKQQKKIILSDTHVLKKSYKKSLGLVTYISSKS